jgi:hypothetical protein
MKNPDQESRAEAEAEARLLEAELERIRASIGRPGPSDATRIAIRTAGIALLVAALLALFLMQWIAGELSRNGDVPGRDRPAAEAGR